MKSVRSRAHTKQRIELGHGMTADEIVKAWGGKVSRDAIAESVRLARPV